MSACWEVGDLLILNEVEQPCGRMVCIVSSAVDASGFYGVQYMNADPLFDSYCRPHMKNKLERATKLEDFGVSLRNDGTNYWCEQTGTSSAVYSDGEARNWQERGQIRYVIRSSVFPYMQTKD